jgi:Soluble lytic murein transglycosylase and related regulatory proteins (some contain LysM/invasin domains)
MESTQVIVYALIQIESGYRADSESPRGAMVLMQLMPGTALRYNVGNPFDPASNIDAGTRHLRTLLDEFGTRDALPPYNAGEGPVRQFVGIPPYSETRKYVSRILDIAEQQVQIQYRSTAQQEL